MQRIARAIEHLPVTHLEIVTVTYAPMNFVIYIFRWNVPLNDRLECSKNQIRERQIIVMVQENLSEVGRSPRSKNRSQRRGNWLGRQSAMACKWYMSLSGWGSQCKHRWFHSTWIRCLFCRIAWSFSFLTHAELLFWRISRVAINVVPVRAPLMIVLVFFCDRDFKFEKYGDTALYSTRAVTLVLAFT